MWLHGWWVSPDTDNNDYRYAALRGAQSATKLHPRAGGVVPQDAPQSALMPSILDKAFKGEL